MEESYRKERPASSSESCANELTRSNSGASSISVANFKNTLLQSGNATTDKYTGWTNEKHNKFLDCLEASFVKQLHRYMASCAGSVEMNLSCRNLSEELSAHFNKTSEQFLVEVLVSCISRTLQKCFCTLVGSSKYALILEEPTCIINISDSDDCLKYLRGDGHHQVLDSQFCCELHCKGKRTRDERFSSSEHKTRSHLILSKPGELQKTVCRVTEGSGQNFMDEDFDKNSSCKKMKTASVDTTDQEQVVPTRNVVVQELLVPCSREITK